MLHLQGLVPPLHQLRGIYEIADLVAWYCHYEFIRNQFGPWSWILALGVNPLKIGYLIQNEHGGPHGIGNGSLEVAQC